MISAGEKHHLRNWSYSLEGRIFQNRIWWLISWKSNEFCFLVKTSAWIWELNSCYVRFLFNPWQDDGLYLTGAVMQGFQDQVGRDWWAEFKKILWSGTVQKLRHAFVWGVVWRCGYSSSSDSCRVQLFTVLTVPVIPLYSTNFCPTQQKTTADFIACCRVGSDQCRGTVGKLPYFCLHQM